MLTFASCVFFFSFLLSSSLLFFLVHDLSFFCSSCPAKTSTTSSGAEKAASVLEEGGRGKGRPEAQVQLHGIIGCERGFFVQFFLFLFSFFFLLFFCRSSLAFFFNPFNHCDGAPWVGFIFVSRNRLQVARSNQILFQPNGSTLLKLFRRFDWVWVYFYVVQYLVYIYI